jgi:hypothetical protein
MRILVTATVQFKTSVGDGCSYNQAIHAIREDIEIAMVNTVPFGYDQIDEINVNPIQIENLDSEDGSFK